NGIIQRFLDNPEAEVDAACADRPVTPFKTESDVIAVPALRKSLGAGIFGGLVRLVVSATPGLLIALFLLPAVPVYAVVAFRRRRRRASAPPRSGAVGLAVAAAPWLAIGAGLIALVFVIGFLISVVVTLITDQNLIGIGAIS